MKKLYILILTLFLFFCSIQAEADNAQRKITTGKQSSSAVIATVASTIYDIDIVATSANGYACVFDSASVTTSGKNEVIEIREATQYDSKHKSFGREGLKVYEGIYLYLNNATATITYY